MFFSYVPLWFYDPIICTCNLCNTRNIKKPSSLACCWCPKQCLTLWKQSSIWDKVKSNLGFKNSLCSGMVILFSIRMQFSSRCSPSDLLMEVPIWLTKPLPLAVAWVMLLITLTRDEFGVKTVRFWSWLSTLWFSLSGTQGDFSRFGQDSQVQVNFEMNQNEPY